MRAYRLFYRDDLVRIASTITDFMDRKRFTSQIVDNTNYQRDVGGRTVAKLYEVDIDEVLGFAEKAGGISFEEVPE